MVSLNERLDEAPRVTKLYLTGVHDLFGADKKADQALCGDGGGIQREGGEHPDLASRLPLVAPCRESRAIALAKAGPHHQRISL